MAARKNKIKHDEKTKEAIRATQLVNFLAKAALDEKQGKKIDPVRVAAAKAVLPFLRPVLSAVEQTNVDPRDKLDPAELAVKLASMFHANPGLYEQVMALRDAANKQPSVNTQEEKHTTH